MLSIIAMVGDAKALSHLHQALDGYVDVTCVHGAGELATHATHAAPDIVVLGIADAAHLAVRLTVREAIARRPTTRLLVACRYDRDDLRAIAHLMHLDIWDFILPHSDSPATTRRCVLDAAPGHLADMEVRRIMCRHAPAWLRPLIEWCVAHDGVARPDVRSLATTCNMRRETLARLCRARGVCPPNHILSWVHVVRARARMDTPRHTLAEIAHDLGLASASSLANLIQRRTGQTPTQIRALDLDKVAERAAQAMFGRRVDNWLLAPSPAEGAGPIAR